MVDKVAGMKKSLLFFVFLGCSLQSQLVLSENFNKAARFFGTTPETIAALRKGEDVGNSSSFWQNVGQSVGDKALMVVVGYSVHLIFTQSGNALYYLHKNYWLTAEQRAEVLKQEEEEREYIDCNRRIQIELAKDPRWPEIVIREKDINIKKEEIENQKHLQAIELGSQRLWDNRIVLEGSARKEELERAKHIEEMLKKVNGPERSDLEKEYKEYIVFCIRKNTEVNSRKI
jgi:hypothetical protein